MNRTTSMADRQVTTRRQLGGFTLIELMIAVTISLVILSALVALFVNTMRNNNEMAKTSGLIENGRFALQVIESDLVHAGFWGGFVPQFDAITSTAIPGDVPTAIPDPCQAYNTWTQQYRVNVIGIPVQVLPALPAGAACVSFPALMANTDVLLIRHAETCLPGVNNCAAAVAGRPYFQTPRCATERSAGVAQVVAIPSSSTMQLAATATGINGAYVGMVVRTLSGTGMNQYTQVTAYDGATKVATINPAWTVLPDNTTTFSFEYLLGTTAFPLTERNCATAASRYRYMSNIYYVTNVAHPDNAGEFIPTLVRSQFDLAAGTLAHQAPVPLIEGVQALRVELGIDDTMTRCAPATAVNYAVAPAKVNPATCLVDADTNLNTLATNRGDGIPDRYKRCTAAVPCTVAELTNVVSARVYVLVRNRETTPGYTDSKTYCLGSPAANGSCPAANLVAAANDHYKRHVFTTTVRLVNLSGRRDTP